MFNLSGSEMVFLLLIALVVLGPEKLPEAVRKFGKTYGELKKMSSGFQSELRSALDEPMKEMRETADTLRQAVSVDFEPERVEPAVATPGTPAAPAAVSSPMFGSPAPTDGVTDGAVPTDGGNGEIGAAPAPAGDFAPMLPDDALPDQVAGE